METYLPNRSNTDVRARATVRIVFLVRANLVLVHGGVKTRIDAWQDVATLPHPRRLPHFAPELVVSGQAQDYERNDLWVEFHFSDFHLSAKEFRSSRCFYKA